MQQFRSLARARARASHTQSISLWPPNRLESQHTAFGWFFFFNLFLCCHCDDDMWRWGGGGKAREPYQNVFLYTTLFPLSLSLPLPVYSTSRILTNGKFHTHTHVGTSVSEIENERKRRKICMERSQHCWTYVCCVCAVCVRATLNDCRSNTTSHRPTMQNLG